MMRTIMRLNRMLAVVTAIAGAVCFSIDAPAQAPDKSKWPSRLTIVTGPASGFGFPTGSAWASAVGAAVGIPISVEATTGLQVNPLLVEEGKADVGLSASDTSLESWNGADWTKGRKIRNQRALVVLDPWVMQIYTSVLTDFFQHHLPPRVEQMPKLVIRAARTAQNPNSVGYKVMPDAFVDFRHQWERLLMEQMVNFCGDESTSTDAGDGGTSSSSSSSASSTPLTSSS